MEFEFDKEIDAILRKARGGESVILNNSHLDADEISAFADNALPEKSKVLYTKHLADCDRCRRILSNIILLNAEDETVPVFVAAEEKSFVANIPWYRRLFAFPGLAYSLGALVLVFGGLIGFIALQSSYNSDISQISNRPFETKSSSVANATNNTSATSNATMPTNSMTANTATNSNAASVDSTNSPTNSTANTAVSNSTVTKPQVLSKERAQSTPTKAEEYSCQDCGSGGEDEVAEQPTPSNENKDELTRQMPSKPVKKIERDDENKKDNNADSAVGKAQKPIISNPNSSATTTETINVSGKTFNRRNNVWIDSQYKGQSTTNITRGTEDYKKLDSDLRQTVERLGGTVVIVWKTRAYKIQ